MTDMISPDCAKRVRLTAAGPSAGLRLHSLDGLRGWAAISVVIDHLVLLPLREYVPATSSLLPLTFANGQLAVMIFFVMSGTALTLPFWKRPELETIERLAYGRYIRLTLPIAFACIAANFAVLQWGNSASIAAGILGSEQYSYYLQKFQSWPSIAAYSTLFVYVAPLKNAPIVFLWTMRTEMMGSIAIFLLLLASLKLRKPALIITLFLVPTFLMNMFVSGFFIGALLGYLHQNGKFASLSRNHVWNYLSPLLVLSCFFTLYALRTIDASTMKANVLIASLIVAICISSRSMSAFLTTPISTFLGKVSFPLYLTHYIFLVTFLPQSIIALEDRDMLNQFTATATSLASVALALGFAVIALPVERLAVFLSRQFAVTLIRLRKTRRIGMPISVPDPAA